MTRGLGSILGGAAVAAAIVAAAGAGAAEEVRYTTHIAGIVDRRCGGCHGSDAPEYGAFKLEKEKFVAASTGPRMDTYSHLIFYTGWPDTGALMRRLDDGKGAPEGKAGNMYGHLGADEAERQRNLALFKAWVGNWTRTRFADLTKEELAGITVRY